MTKQEIKECIAKNIAGQFNQIDISGKLAPILESILDQFSAGALFKGLATPETDPGALDGEVFYFATEAGVYENFGGIELDGESLVILKWNGEEWTEQILPVPTSVVIQSLVESIAEEFVKYAKVDGEYPFLISGLAINLKGDEIAVEDGYTDKATAYKAGDENEVADGPVVMSGLKGRAMAWNQLVTNGDISEGVTDWEGGTLQEDGSIVFENLTGAVRTIHLNIPTFTGVFYVAVLAKKSGSMTYDADIRCFTSEHNIFVRSTEYTWYKGIFSGETTKGSITVSGSGNLHIKSFKIICVTLLATSLAANPNLTPADVEAWLEARKSLKPYFPYNAGQLIGARMLGWSLRKTANLLNPTTKKARLVPIHYTGHDNEYTVTGWDELTNAALQFTPDDTGVAEAVTLDANSRFVIPSTGWLEVVASGGDITGDITKVCVKATYDGSRDDEVVAYAEDAHEFDSANIYHKSGDVYSQVFDGGILREAGSVADELGFDSLAGKCFAKVMTGSRAYAGGDESDADVITDKTNTWYALENPTIYTSDLYYKTGENTYIPLEEVWPINGICNNWATESLIQQEDDANGQPKSITPATVEEFNYDYKEALRTVLDTYVSKEQEKKDVDALLSCVNTNCATAIGGTITTDGYDASGTLKFVFSPAEP